MKAQLAILLLFLMSCRDSENSTHQIIVISKLITNQEWHKADSLYRLLKNKKEIDFDYRTLGLTLKTKQKNFHNAKIEADEFIELYPQSFFGYYYAGLSEYYLDNPKSALHFFSKSLSLISDLKNGLVYVDTVSKNPYNSIFNDKLMYVDVIFMIAASESAIGGYETANSHYNACIAQRYKISESYKAMADNYERLNDTANANKCRMMVKKFLDGKSDAIIKLF